jgi:DNA-binding winged helix-turn-helix (wHTH) protein
MPVYRFGAFCLDTDAYCLTCEGKAIAASPRQLDLLAYLVARPSRLVTRDELFRELWPDVIVSDNALTQVVSELRLALGDKSATPRYVQTVARRGYRFIGTLQDVDAPQTGAITEPASHVPETFSLDALQAVMDGRLQLEALDSAAVDDAVESFERAIALDPGFAAGYVGLANACFWQYERSRFHYRPDSMLLATAVNHARRGVALAPEFAEAHGTLAYLLAASGRTDEARAAARQAIALHPQQWSHYFRLGHASWGEERLEALTRCLLLYPAFPFAHFQMAMVYVARQALDMATRVLEEGIAVQEGMGGTRCRFPASGLHWMLGSILLTRRDVDGALAEFEREISGTSRALYAREFSVAALNSRGFALVSAGRLEEAREAFGRSLAGHDEQARPHLGLALIGRSLQQAGLTVDSLDRAREAIEQLRRGGQTVEAVLMAAGQRIVEERHDEAVAMLDRLTTEMPSGSTGWAIPIDPLFGQLAKSPALGPVLRRVAARAM